MQMRSSVLPQDPDVILNAGMWIFSPYSYVGIAYKDFLWTLLRCNYFETDQASIKPKTFELSLIWGHETYSDYSLSLEVRIVLWFPRRLKWVGAGINRNSPYHKNYLFRFEVRPRFKTNFYTSFSNLKI
jgi:hypothetical protein